MSKIEIMPFDNKKIEALHKVGIVGEHFLMHVHGKYEIYVSVSGNSKYFIGQKIYDVDPYDVFLFNNTDVHRIHTYDAAAYERYVIMFPPDVLSKFDEETTSLLRIFETEKASRVHKLKLPKPQINEFLGIVKKLIACNTDERHTLLKQKIYLTELLLMINEIAKSSDDAPYTASSDDKRINEIMTYIRDNCQFPISLDELSKKFFLNKYYLCRLFKSKLGFGINSYIESCRLSNAVPLLQQGRTVSEVAFKTGFGSDAYFINTFKNTFGMSPKKYIKELNS